MSKLRKILFINSVQTSLLTPLQCGEGVRVPDVETFHETSSYHGVSEGVCVSDVETFPETSPYDGACSVLPSPHWRRAGDEVSGDNVA